MPSLTEKIKEMLDQNMLDEALSLLKTINTDTTDINFALYQAAYHFCVVLNTIRIDQDAFWHLERGMALKEQAISSEKTVLTENERWLLFYAAETLLSMERLTDQLLGASEVLQRIISTPNISEEEQRYACVRLAELYLNLGKVEEAITIAKNTLDVSNSATAKELVDCLAALSLAYTFDEQQQSASLYLSKAKAKLNEIKEKDKYPKTILRLKTAELMYLERFAHGSEKQRILLCNEILDLTPIPEFRAELMIDKGRAQFDLQQFREAADSFKSAIEEDPANAIANNAYLHAGVANYNLSQWKTASKYFEAPLPENLPPERRYIYEMYRGHTFLKVGKLRLAKQSYEWVLSCEAASAKQIKIARKQLKRIAGIAKR